jgi:hypothetical protein
MMRFVVDTNVPIVANGRPGRAQGGRAPSIDCRRAAIDFLERLLDEGRVIVDLEGEILEEYRRHLSPSGQPGVGDRFYFEIVHRTRVEQVALPRNDDGEYADFPRDPDLAGFDRSDRKFAALARRVQVPVANATDSDWLDHREALARNRIEVRFVCGCDREGWFASDPTGSHAPGAGHRRRRIGG